MFFKFLKLTLTENAATQQPPKFSQNRFEIPKKLNKKKSDFTYNFQPQFGFCKTWLSY